MQPEFPWSKKSRLKSEHLSYAHLTDSRSLVLVGDSDANAYELLFAFSSSEEKKQVLELIRSNLDMGNDYIENDLLSPTTEEIKHARPLAIGLTPGCP